MLPLIFTLALDTATPVSPPDGSYTYVSSGGNAMGGGKTTITVKHSPSGVLVSEAASGNANGQNGTIKTLFSLGNDLAPVSYDATVTGAARTAHWAVAFKGSSATESGDVGAKTFDLVADAKGFVLLDAGPLAGPFMWPAQLAAWKDAPAIGIVPAVGQSLPIAVDTSVKPDRPATVPATDAQITISNPLQITMWYDPATMIVDELDIPAQNVTVTRQK